MGKLIKLQIRNVFHNPLFYVCLIILLLSTIGINYLTDIILKATPTKVVPGIVSFLSSEIGIIGIIFIALYCCYDYSEGTTKNIIGRGYTKTQYLFSKYIGSTLGLFVMYLVCIIITSIVNIKNGMGYQNIMSIQIINSIVEIIAYTILYATMSVIIEKNGGSILACLFVPNIISIIISLLDSKLHLKISNYWIENISEKLTNKPTMGNLSLSILYYVIYIVVFALIGVTILKKKEIK